MPAMKGGGVEDCLLKPPPAFSGFLIFGQNEGLVSDRARRLARALVDDPADSMQLIRVAGDALSDSPSRLADEFFAISMFGGRRAIVVTSGLRQITQYVEPLLGAPRGECAFIVTAGKLKKDSPLRLLFERSGHGAAIECQPDKPEDIADLVDKELKAAGLGIERDARKALVALVGADRLMTRSELSKLICYVHGRATVTIEDIRDSIADASEMFVESTVAAAFAGARPANSEARIDAQDVQLVLAAALRQAIELHNQVAAGDADRPRGYGQWQPTPPSRNWTAPKATRVAGQLQRALLLSRQFPALAPMIAARALTAIGSMASRP